MKTIPLFSLFALLIATPAAKAQSLEDILRPKGPNATLSTTSADEAWRRVVNAFRANDMAKATEEGNGFLATNYKASALQVMGVKVMVSLAGGAATGTMFENREDLEAFKRVEADRASIVKRYTELQSIYTTNDATVNRITMNRKRPVQQGSANYYECMECDRQMTMAKKALEELQGPIEANKRQMAELQAKANQNLKPTTLRLLDGLLEAGEIDAAIAIANTYIRIIGNDMEVALKQQDITRLQEANQKAVQIMDLFKKDIDPFISRRLFWEANEKAQAFLAKVETMSPDRDLLRFVKSRAKLDPLGLERSIALGQRQYDLVHAQAELDATMAMQEFSRFKLDYPDHPKLKELELYVNTNNVKSADQVLAKAEADFDELKKRFDPEKLRVALNRKSDDASKNSGVVAEQLGTKKSSEDMLVEMGVAPADSRMAKVTLEGLSASLTVLEKVTLPLDRRSRLMAIKTEIDGMMNLVHP